MKASKKLIGTLCLLAFLPQPVHGTGQLPLRVGQLQGVAIPLYSSTRTKPAVIIRIASIYQDHQRRGFFRIGLLPIVAADDVRIEILTPDGMSAIAQPESWIRQWTGETPVEWRRVVFTVPGQKIPRLEAGKARLDKPGRLRLLDGVVVRTGTNEIRISSALLQLSGPEAGTIGYTHANQRISVRLLPAIGVPAD